MVCLEEVLNILRKQYESSEIISEEDTIVGFYIDFKVTDENLRIKKENFTLGDVYGTYKGMFGAIGFVLFKQNGFISFLEGYSIIEGVWPPDEEIVLSYQLEGQRELRIP